MYCLEADIVRQNVKISYQIKNRNWRYSCTKGLCKIQLAFVALKALHITLKGQNFAPDTMEILLFNAYHWNPCWKVDEQCCISGCLRYVSTKVQLFSYIYFAMNSAAFQYIWLWSLCLLLYVWFFKKAAIFNQSQSSWLSFCQNCAITQPRIPCPIGRQSRTPRVTMVTLQTTRGRGERRNQSVT